MAYIFKKKEDVVEYLRQMEFTLGNDYSFYVVPNKMYTTRFNIFYKAEQVGFVENENFNEVSSNVWVIHIPAEKRAFLDAEQPGIYEAIFTEPTNSDGDIDKKYYIDPKAFNRVIVKDSKNKAYQLTATGPGSYIGLKFDNDFVKINTTELEKGMSQVTINIDGKSLASKLRYDLAEEVGNFSVTDPAAITLTNVTEYPSIIAAMDMRTKARWVPLSSIEVSRAAVSAKAEALEVPNSTDLITANDLITTDNFTESVETIFNNSTQYGFGFGYEVTNDEEDSYKPYIFARDYNINLIGDISGEATVKDFTDVDIQCTLAPTAIEKIATRTGKSITFGTEKFTINNMDISYDEDRNVVFNIPENKTYKFNINDTTAFTINTGGGNDLAEEFEADPNLTYNDGDLVGICEDGVVRPLAYGKVVNYIGVVTTKPAVTCGAIKFGSKVLVALIGKKDCYVKTNNRDIVGLIGKKVLAVNGDNAFSLWDSTFDIGKKYDGIIIGNIYETSRPGVIKATILLK